MSTVEILGIAVLGGGFLALVMVLFYKQVMHFKQLKRHIQEEKDNAILNPLTKVSTGTLRENDVAIAQALGRAAAGSS